MHRRYIIKSFSDLTTLELYQILRLRSEVFVVEQHCAYLDPDNKDLESHHLMSYVDGHLSGYARLLPPGLSYKESSIGRVIIAPAFRGYGLGKQLVQKSIDACEALFKDSEIRISAQYHLLKFYSTLDFSETGEPYEEDGILHIEMIRK